MGHAPTNGGTRSNYDKSALNQYFSASRLFNFDIFARIVSSGAGALPVHLEHQTK
jgi:hypothetical protein